MSLALPYFTPRGTVLLTTGSASLTATVGAGDIVRALNEGTQTIAVSIGTAAAVATASLRLPAGSEVFIKKAPSELSMAAINLSALTTVGLVSFTDGYSV